MLTNFMPLRFCSSANKNYNSSEMQMCVNIKKKKKKSKCDIHKKLALFARVMLSKAFLGTISSIALY